MMSSRVTSLSYVCQINSLTFSNLSYQKYMANNITAKNSRIVQIQYLCVFFRKNVMYFKSYNSNKEGPRKQFWIGRRTLYKMFEEFVFLRPISEFWNFSGRLLVPLKSTVPKNKKCYIINNARRMNKNKLSSKVWLDSARHGYIG